MADKFCYNCGEFTFCQSCEVPPPTPPLARKCGMFFRTMGRGKFLEWDCGQLADESERLAGGAAAGLSFGEQNNDQT